MDLVDAFGAVSKDSDSPNLLSVSEAVERLQDDVPFLDEVAVKVTVEDEIDLLVDHLGRIALIQLEFGHFKDGRPFTTAFTLRKRHGFEGELRAAGDILPDQATYLVRSGFSTLVVPEALSSEEFRIALGDYSVAYQTAVGGRQDLIQRTRFSAHSIAAE